MSEPFIKADGVWKKFRRGEVHDSLRDLLPYLARSITKRNNPDLSREDFWVLQDVSFEVRPGEALGIIGPNGAGKSTTLKLLSRIMRPTLGRVKVRGRVGALIEVAAGFHPDLTGRENVFLQGAIMGMRSRVTRERFDEIVAFSGVEEFIDTPMKRYSSGMKARLGFSIAAHLDPDVLLIDEVLSVGDLSFRQKCHDRLGQIREAGVPIVFVSHNLQAVASICDRVLLLRRGLPAQLGCTGTMIQEYTSGAIAGTDARVEVSEASLRHDASGRLVAQPISPGEALKLDLVIEAKEHLGSCGVALTVRRADGTQVFDALVDSAGEELLDLSAGMRIEGSIRFRANLLRGVYTVGIVIFDELRIRPHIRLDGLTSFTVSEDRSTSGYASLEPVGDLKALG